MAWASLCCFAQPAGAAAAFNEPTQVTTHPGEDFAPSFFPDGRAMVYVSDKSGNLDLWWKRLGSGVRPPDRQLTFHAAADTSPSLSPDGKWVAFISNRSDPKGDLYLLPLDVSGLEKGQEAEAVRLTDASSSESDPVWSADQRFVFFSSLDAGSSLKNIYRLDIKTKSKTLVTALDGVNLALSPDGRRLAFVSRKDDPSSALWVKDLHRNYTVQVTQGPDIDVSPKWSRDGRHIYFVRYRDDTNQDGQLTIDDRPNIWKVTLGRFGMGEVQQLTDSSTYDLFPSEAGGKLFFTSTRKDNIDIWELPIDGALPLPNDYRDAVKIVEDLCSGPDSVSYRCLLAFTNLAEKFKKESGISRIRYRLGEIYLEMGHSGLAEKIFRSILASSPDDPAYRGLAEIELLLLRAENSKEQGETVYRKTLGKILGTIRQDTVFDPGLLNGSKMDQSANVMTLENLAKREQPRVAARARLEMGHLYFELDELSLALEFYQKVIQDYPRQRTLAAEAAFSQSKIYATVGDRGELVKAFVRVAGEYRDVERWARKAIREIFSLFEKQSTLEKKVSSLSALSQRHEETPLLAAALQNRIGELYYLAHENLLAKEAYKKTVARFPAVVSERLTAQFALARIYAEEENFEGSLKLYQEIAAASKASDELRNSQEKAREGYIRKSIQKGTWELKVGEIKLALKTFLKLIEFSPETIEAHRGYVQANAALRQVGVAIQFYKTRLKPNQTSAANHYSLGLAYTYLDPPDFDKAETEISQALAINAQSAFFHQTLGFVFEQKENLLNQKGYLERALDEYQIALALNDEELDPENESNLMLNLGNGHYLMKNFNTAYYYYQGRARARRGFADQNRAAIFYQRFGESAFKAGAPEEASRYFLEALEIFSEKKELERMAELNDRIALAYQEQGLYAKAGNHFAAAMELNQQTGNAKSLPRSLRNIANNLFWMSQEAGEGASKLLSEALNKYFQAMENLEKYGVVRQKKRKMEGLVNIEIEAPLNEEASTAASGFDETGEKKMIFHYIGKIYGDFKEYEKAIDYYNKRLALIPKNLDPEKNVPVILEKALLQNQIANFHYLRGDADSSLRYFKASYQLSKQLENRRGVAVNAANIGRVLLSKFQTLPPGPLRGELKSSIQLLKDALAQIKKSQVFPHPEYGVFIRNYLGIFYYYLALQDWNGPPSPGKDQKRRPSEEVFLAAYRGLKNEYRLMKKSAGFFKRALNVARGLDAGPERNRLESALRQNLLLINQLSGKHAGGEQTIQIQNELLPFRWQFKFLQSLEKEGQGRLPLLLEAEKLLARLPYDFYPSDPSAMAMQSELYRSLTWFLFHRRKFSDALSFSEKGLQSMLISMRQGGFRKFRGFDDEARQGLYEMLEDYRSRMRAAINGAASGAPDLTASPEAEDVEAVLDEYHLEFLPFLREEDRELASLFYPEVPDFEEIRARMRPGELILKYQKIREQILIWVLDSSSVKGGIVRCGPKLLAVLSRLAADAGSIRAGDIEELSARLIEPVKSYLENARELSLIAAGPLEFLPWAALSFGEGTLVEALPISYLSSLPHYYFSRSKRNLYNSRLLAAEFPQPAFGNIKKRFASAVNLAGKEGTLDEFRALRGNYGALHIEGKALLRGADPLASYISLTQKANHFERWRMKDLFKETVNANFIALGNVEVEFGSERGVSPTAPLLQGLTFSGYPGVLLRQGVADPKVHEEFLDLFYQDFREGKPAESLRRAQVELARRHPDSLAWTGYRFYGYPGMEGEERRDFAQTHFDGNMEKGDDAFRGEDWEAAMGYYENALILSTFLQDVRVQEKDFYNILSEAAFNLRDYPKAIHYQSEALKLAEKANDQEQIAEAVYFLGILHSRAERYTQAVKLLQKALSIYQENGLLDRLAEGYSALGIVEENALDYGQALRAFTVSLKINEELGAVLNKGHELRRIGRIYYLRLGQYDQAEKFYAEANALFKKLGQTDQIVETLLELGLVAEKRADFDRALTLYREAQSLAEENELQSGLSKALLYQANSHWFQGNYQQAFRMQRQSLEIAEAIGDKRQQTFIYNTLGLIYWTLNDSQRALRNLETSLELAREIKSTLDMASAFNNIGLVYRKDKKYETSIKFFNKALERDLQLKSKWGQGYTHRNLGMSYLRIGDLDQAETHINQALTLSREIGNRTNLVKSMLESGNLNMKKGNCSRALVVFDETAALAESLGIPEVRWRALRGRGFCLVRLNRPDDAIEAYKQAVAVVDQMRAAIKIEEFQNGFLTDKQDVYKELILLLLDQGKVEESFIFSERAKSRSFIDLLGNQKISLKNDVSQKLYDNLVRQKKTIRSVEESIGRSEDEEKIKQLSAELVAARDKYDDLLIEAKEQSPQISSFVTVESIGLAETQQLLEEDVALVEYLVTQEELIAWVVKKTSLDVVRVPVREEDLNRLVKDYRKRIQQLAPLDEQIAQLYSWLIKPIEKYVDDTRVLGLIPNGILHYVSFASLKGEEGYLVEKYPLFYSPSASVLKFTFGRKYDKSKIIKVLALGNPDLGSLNYDLPLAEMEVNAIKWDFPQVDILTGSEAKESWLKEHINDYQIIHIASHGEFDTVNPLFSALKLTRDEADDGNFEVNEVFSLTINADLVTLSACQTGLGKITGGDELVGLNRAFIYAGTHAIVSSLWRVSDVSTSVLIKHFYRNYVREPKAESLRKAQLLVKKFYPHPGYWAGFNLTGDYR